MVRTSTSRKPTVGTSATVTGLTNTGIGGEHAPTATSTFGTPEILYEKLPVTVVPGSASLQTSTKPIGTLELVKTATVSVEMSPDTAITVAVPFARSREGLVSRRFSIRKVTGLK